MSNYLPDCLLLIDDRKSGTCKCDPDLCVESIDDDAQCIADNADVLETAIF